MVGHRSEATEDRTTATAHIGTQVRNSSIEHRTATAVLNIKASVGQAQLPLMSLLSVDPLTNASSFLFIF
jgi:hypothetical protein